MPKLTTCKSCGKEVAKSAKSCPHCGAKLKMGVGLKLIIGLAVIGAVFAFVVPSPDKEKAAADRLRDLQNMASLKADEISPHGELAEMYKFGSDYTDLQRDAKEKELTGKLVEWKLSVFEVDIDDKEKKIYKVQTSGASSTVDAFVHIHAMDDEDERILSGLKTGNVIHFKGKIKGVSMRSIRIDPAILVRNRVAPQSPAAKFDNAELMRAVFGDAYNAQSKSALATLSIEGSDAPHAMTPVASTQLPDGRLALIVNGSPAGEDGSDMSAHVSTGVLNVYLLQRDGAQWKVLERHQNVAMLGSSGGIGRVEWVILGPGKPGFIVFNGGIWQGYSISYAAIFELGGKVRSLGSFKQASSSEGACGPTNDECWDVTGDISFAAEPQPSGYSDIVVSFDDKRYTVTEKKTVTWLNTSKVIKKPSSAITLMAKNTSWSAVSIRCRTTKGVQHENIVHHCNPC